MIYETQVLLLNAGVFLFQSPEDSSAVVKQLQEQLATLTSSLATVSGEKSKMEANFLAEKKKIRVGSN